MTASLTPPTIAGQISWIRHRLTNNLTALPGNDFKATGRGASQNDKMGFLVLDGLPTLPARASALREDER
jgi:hypothetical protein